MTRKEFIAACKKAGACQPEFDRLIRAKTDAKFWGVALVNYDWCKRKGLGKAQDFLRLGADVNAKNNSGWTALMYAERCGHTEIEELLKKAGAK